ncbi:MAG: CapA family protein [Clostridiales bacterium]|nr:CapA family protein [Clostridiales bacterium]
MCLLIVLCAAQFTGRIESRILGKINEAVTANETGRIAVEQAAVRFFSYNDGNMDSQSATYDPRGSATVQESKDDSTENGSFENNSTGNSTTGSSGTGSSSTGSNSTGNNTTEENNKGLSGGSGTNKEKDKLSELLAEGYIAVEPADPDFISISFAGDILLDERYAIMAAMLQRSGGEVPAADTAFDEKLLSEMREADIFMLNNEFPYSDRGAPLQGKKYTFRARP